MATQTGGVRGRNADWHGDESARSNAARVIPELLRLLLDRGATAIQPGNHADELHQFRLDIKRFRYTLELFVPIYGPVLEPLLERLRRLQSLLGDMNDCVATAEHLSKLRSGLPAELDDYLRRRYDACFSKLTTEWSRHLAKPAEQDRWSRLLAFQSADGQPH